MERNFGGKLCNILSQFNHLLVLVSKCYLSTKQDFFRYYREQSYNPLSQGCCKTRALTVYNRSTEVYM